MTPWQAYDAEWLKQAVEEERSVQEYFTGDFYPLPSYSLAGDVWAAWQWNRSDLTQGLVLAFRRSQSPVEEITAVLRGLDENLEYHVVDRDSQERRVSTGQALMSRGLSIRIPGRSQAVVLVYRGASPQVSQ